MGHLLQVWIPGRLFADGLRYDVARQLQKELEVMGITGSLSTRWAGLPTVIATAKPAITPLIGEIQGQALPEEFAPSFHSGKPTSAAELRKAPTAQGYTVLGDDQLNIPSGPEARGWLEIGDLDHRGHQLQNDLPRQIQPELERLALRIQKLLEAGWRSVKVVTDHGWLFCPDGLPSAELPKHVTAGKWARCAAINGDSRVDRAHPCFGGLWWIEQCPCGGHHRDQLERPALQPGSERRNGRHDSRPAP
jgi:hypothetical protein